MPAYSQSNKVTGVDVQPNPNFAGEVGVARAVVNLPATVGINDIIEMLILPAGCTPIDAMLDVDDLDTGTTMTLNVGVMSGDVGTVDTNRTVGTELFSADTVAQAGGLKRMVLATGVRIAGSGVDRSIGVKVLAAPTGSTAGVLGLTMWYRNP